MAVIPGRVVWEGTDRSNLDHSRYAQLTWRWWCHLHSAHFLLIDHNIGGARYNGLPPTFQRWLVPQHLCERFGCDIQILMVDADTMVRWDMPDIFAVAQNGLSAVRDDFAHWIFASLRAYTPLFRGVTLPWWEYFNSGVVLMSGAQASYAALLVEFALENDAALSRIRESGNFGIDQTPLNLFLRSHNIPVHFMPPPFNLLRCFPMNEQLRALEKALDRRDDYFKEVAFRRAGVFSFIHLAYIWHFTNVVKYRRVVMEQTWSFIREHYSGAETLD